MKINYIFYNHYLIAVIILLLFNYTIASCYSLRETTIDNDQSIKIYKLETISGDTIDFNKSKLGYATLLNDNVVSINSIGKQESFPMSNVKKYYTEKFDFGKTIFLIVGSVILLYAILISLFALALDGRGFGG